MPRFAVSFLCAGLAVCAIVFGVARLSALSAPTSEASAKPHVVQVPSGGFDPNAEECPDVFRTPIQTIIRNGEPVRYLDEYTRSGPEYKSECPQGFGAVYDAACGYDCVRRVRFYPGD